MNAPRVNWEPDNQVPLEEIKFCLEDLIGKDGGVTIMQNGTLLFIHQNSDNVLSARLALEEAKYLTDFRVKRLPNGDFLVALHKAVAVFVGSKEFITRRVEIIRRVDELKFPHEEIFVPKGWTQDEYLVGLYGRGKLQQDINKFNFYARIN